MLVCWRGFWMLVPEPGAASVADEGDHAERVAEALQRVVLIHRDGHFFAAAFGELEVVVQELAPDPHPLADVAGREEVHAERVEHAVADVAGVRPARPAGRCRPRTSAPQGARSGSPPRPIRGARGCCPTRSGCAVRRRTLTGPAGVRAAAGAMPAARGAGRDQRAGEQRENAAIPPRATRVLAMRDPSAFRSVEKVCHPSPGDGILHPRAGFAKLAGEPCAARGGLTRGWRSGAGRPPRCGAILGPRGPLMSVSASFQAPVVASICSVAASTARLVASSVSRDFSSSTSTSSSTVSSSCSSGTTRLRNRELASLGCREAPAGEDQLSGHGGPDLPHQARDSAPRQRDPEVHLRNREHGRLAGDAQIAGRREHHGAADAVARGCAPP